MKINFSEIINKLIKFSTLNSRMLFVGLLSVLTLVFATSTTIVFFNTVSSISSKPITTSVIKHAVRKSIKPSTTDIVPTKPIETNSSPSTVLNTRNPSNTPVASKNYSNTRYIIVATPSVSMESNETIGPFSAYMSDGSSAYWGDSPLGESPNIFGYNKYDYRGKQTKTYEFYIRANENTSSGTHILKFSAYSDNPVQTTYEAQISVTVANKGTFTITVASEYAEYEATSAQLVVPYVITRINNYEGPIEVSSYPRVLVGQPYVAINATVFAMGDYGAITLSKSGDVPPGTYTIQVNAYNEFSTITASDTFEVLVE